MDLLLRDLEAFIGEHRRCGELDTGVEGERVWMTCTCGARMVRDILRKCRESARKGERERWAKVETEEIPRLDQIRILVTTMIHRATVICDDFRVEGNGKLILLGILARRVWIPQSSAMVPLCLFQIFEAERAGSHALKVEVRNSDNHVVLEGMLELTAGSPGAILYSVVKFPAVILSEGDYVVRSLATDGAEIGAERFSVSVGQE